MPIKTAALLAAALLVTGCSNLNEGIDESLRSVGAIGTTNGIALTRPGPGRWIMTINMFQSNADMKALYRAAILAKAAGYSHYQVVDYEDGAERGSTRIAIVGVNDAAAPLDCRADTEGKPHCATWGVDERIATLGPRLGHTPALIAKEVEEAKAAERRAYP